MFAARRQEDELAKKEELAKSFHYSDDLNRAMSGFQNRLEDLFRDSAKDRASLQSEVRMLAQLNQEMSLETKNLTKALRGDKKLQGNWGEVILERVLESSGLRKGFEYETQVTLTDDNNKVFRPDVIVTLPDDRRIIIDSKVSLIDYANFVKHQETSEAEVHLERHYKCITSHIKNLAEKKYDGLVSPSIESVLMFLPVEAAFTCAMEFDSSLFEFASSKNVIITTPNTLLLALKVVNSTWKNYTKNKNTDLISSMGTKMLDKTSDILEELDALGKMYDKQKSSYDSLIKKISQGRGNLVSLAKQLRDLGISTDKKIPENFNELHKVSEE